MGEVYRARDTKLGREVAVKALPEQFAHDPESLSRLEREAKLLASLNHTNIASIYGLEESGRSVCLIMELVPGETLADRIRAGPLPIKEALNICSQIAEALEAAHSKGIVHRDLKPANVKITPDGKVKVLDFGLAEALLGEGQGADLTQAATTSLAATREEQFLGTPPYMSPGQVRGLPTDKRADVWAFGCVLYETLSGKRAFAGETISDTIAAILEHDVDWAALPPSTPSNIRNLLRHCLQKDPNNRLRDIGDARLEVEDALTSPATDIAPSDSKVQRINLAWGIGALLVITVALIGIRMLKLQRASSPAPVAHLELAIPPSDKLISLFYTTIALSPDGTHVAYAAVHDGIPTLFLRALDQSEPVAIPNSEGANTPFFSPDGKWLAFVASGQLKKVSTSGGAPIVLFNLPTTRGATWGPDGRIICVLNPATPLFSIPADGGPPSSVTKFDTAAGEQSHRWPQILPGGDAVLFTVGKGKSWDDAEIAVQSIKTGERHTLIQGGTSARYIATGQLVYARAGKLLAVPFDLKRLQVTGPPTIVLDDVLEDEESGVAQFTVSDNGTLIYLPGGLQSSEFSLAWFDRAGKMTPFAGQARRYWAPRLSPDGQKLAVTVATVNDEVWVSDLARGSWTHLTFETGSALPQWTPDGKRVTFVGSISGVAGIYWKLADGSGEIERLLAGTNLPNAWSPDGKVLLYMEFNPKTGRHLWSYSPSGDRKPHLLTSSSANQDSASFSPNGRWIVYESDETGRSEIYVQAYPGPGGKWQISTSGGIDPVWARDGKELFFYSRGKLMTVQVNTEGEFSAGIARVLFDAPFYISVPFASVYDVTPDGKRFIAVHVTNAKPAPTSMQVVTNWFEDVRRAASPK
jgi:serine/threonine protein kinase